VIAFLIRAAIFVVAAALGLLAAAAILDDVEVTAGGFLLTVLIVAVLQSVLTPWIASVAQKYARAFVGGVGLVSTFVALLVATLVGDSLTIRGADTWVLATLVVWVVTALASALLPVVLLKKRAQGGAR
jgi:hypothetical protein